MKWLIFFGILALLQIGILIARLIGIIPTSEWFWAIFHPVFCTCVLMWVYHLERSKK